MSRKKADSQSSVKYLGFSTQGQELPTDGSEEALTRIAVATRRHRGVPGVTRFCHIWTPNFRLTAKPFQ